MPLWPAPQHDGRFAQPADAPEGVDDDGPGAPDFRTDPAYRRWFLDRAQEAYQEAEREKRETEREARIAGEMAVLEEREEARRRHRRKALQDAGETGWKRSNLRQVYEEMGGEPERPTVGYWSRRLLLEGIPADEEDGQGIFYAGKMNLVFGPSESGKSMFAFAVIAQEIEAGRHVIVCDFEDGERGFVSRLIALGLDIEQIDPDGSAPGGAHYFPVRLGMEEDDFQEIRNIVQDYQVSAALIDAVTEAMGAEGLNPDKAVEVARWAASMPKRFARLGPAVILVDHTNLTDGDRAGGSQHKKSMIDGVSLKVAPKERFRRGHGGRSYILVAKDRIGSVREFAKPADRDGGLEYRGMFVMNTDGDPFSMIGTTPLDRDAPAGSGEAPTADSKLAGLVEEVVRIVTENPGVSKTAVRERFEAKASGNARLAAVEEAIRLGRIRAEKGPRNAAVLLPAEGSFDPSPIMVEKATRPHDRGRVEGTRPQDRGRVGTGERPQGT